MTQPSFSAYTDVAIDTLATAKRFCIKQSNDRQHILGLAELLAMNRLHDGTVLREAVVKIASSAAAQDPEFTMTPARIVAEARAIRDDRAARQPTPAAIENVASAQHREQQMTKIRGIIAKTAKTWSIPS